MSRVGRKPIEIPKDVKVIINSDKVMVEGKVGKNEVQLLPGITCTINDNKLQVARNDDSGPMKAKHGLIRALIANAIAGVENKFTKALDIVGVGYKSAVEGNILILNVGYSHPVRFPLPAGIEVKVDKQTHIAISGVNKQLVGQIAADIRFVKKPEPYKGKGIRYSNEFIKLKPGKAAQKAVK